MSNENGRVTRSRKPLLWGLGGLVVGVFLACGGNIARVMGGSVAQDEHKILADVVSD